MIEEEDEDEDDGVNGANKTLGNEFTMKLLLRLMTLVLWLLWLRLDEEMREEFTNILDECIGSDGGGGVKNNIVTMTRN